MKPRIALVVACLATSVPYVAYAEPDPVVQRALEEGSYSFCKKPRQPIFGKREQLCPLAAEIEGCEGYAEACGLRETHTPGWFSKLAEMLGPVAKVLLYAIVIAIVLVVAIPVLRALLRLRRDKQLADDEKSPAVATPIAPPPPPEEISDAEHALREADALRARGELTRALALYLGASLAALDRRGAVRIAKHKTNGEYVRSCTEDGARQPLREIVREVDKVEFGKIPPTDDAVARVASRAAALVRAAVVTVGALLLLGCGRMNPPGNDPAGDDLPRAVLRDAGWNVESLGRSLASLPLDDMVTAPLVVVDTDLVVLEDDTAAHLVRWVDAGGVLVLFGDPSRWPDEIGARPGHAGTRDLVIGPIHGARVARADALVWKDAERIASLGEDIYAAWKPIGQGAVMGVANGDLFSNVGMMPAHNAEALRELFEWPGELVSVREIRIARAEDGISPPSGPFAALAAAGLLEGTWHALAAALVLFLAYGIRHARPRPTPTPARRAFTEHVEATAAFYERTRVFPHALAAYGRFVEMRLRERLPRGADPVAFLAARAEVDPEHAARVYRRATEAKTEDEVRGDELATIKELRSMLVKALDAG